VQVEHVAILPSLEKRAQFGSENLFGRKRYNFCLRLTPVIVDRKRVRFDGVQAGVFASIDLYFEFQSCLRSDCRCELEQ
jgi:hypothetical protein